jgi:hypothetical protein
MRYAEAEIVREWIRGGGLDPGSPLGVITQEEAEAALERLEEDRAHWHRMATAAGVPDLPIEAP